MKTKFDFTSNNETPIHVIIKAAKNHEVVEIMYLDAKSNMTVRMVEPYEIKDGKLYAHCLKRDSIRAFNLEQITNVVLTEKQYSPRFPVKITDSDLQHAPVSYSS